MKKKERLDVILVDRGLIETREKAKRAIMAGLVYSEQERMDKPGQKVDASIPIELKGNPIPYVSRGGLKLEKALQTFHFDVKDKIMIDIGSSTGGFTDCALQNGAKFVYAVDVGYNQLAWKLRNDDRVRVMERTNFRYSKPEDFESGLPHVATIDVSFISLKLILPVLKEILVHRGQVVALVKPQFEAGREEVGKKGIVRDRKIHQTVIDRMIKFSHETGYHVLDCTYSPIRGGEGNIEFLLHLEKPAHDESPFIKWTGNTERVVEQAHASKAI
ncbi:TlyA family RNA methyltransferase [Alkalihalobacillus sp. TS-13]|uniref:TlyA family RNA methyltransferase n=1 Tax=Alkalihalobacillus sp. TS-13 TaxID=2842455 RepID=UPI001C882BE8|nr:TlyA family RNA methyltransferase [Alkalihalobacillus sp. TS-13]